MYIYIYSNMNLLEAVRSEPEDHAVVEEAITMSEQHSTFRRRYIYIHNIYIYIYIYIFRNGVYFSSGYLQVLYLISDLYESKYLILLLLCCVAFTDGILQEPSTTVLSFQSTYFLLNTTILFLLFLKTTQVFSDLSFKWFR